MAVVPVSYSAFWCFIILSYVGETEIMEGNLSCSGYAVGFAPRELCPSTGQCWVKDALPRGPGFMLGCVLHVESCMLKGGSVWVVWDYSAHQPLHITWACCMTSLSTQLFLVLDLISTLYFKPHFQCISQACLLQVSSQYLWFLIFFPYLLFN